MGIVSFCEARCSLGGSGLVETKESTSGGWGVTQGHRSKAPVEEKSFTSLLQESIIRLTNAVRQQNRLLGRGDGSEGLYHLMMQRDESP